MLLMFMQNTQLNKEICTAKQDMHTAPSGICTFWFLLEVDRIGGVTAKNNFGISTSLIFDQQPSKCGEARNISVVGTKSDNFERRTHRRTFVRVTCPKTVPTPVTRSGFFCRTMLCISAAYDAVRCLSIWVSVMFAYCVETSRHILKLFHHSGLSLQTLWRYSDWDPRNGGDKCRGHEKVASFDQYLALSRK